MKNGAVLHALLVAPDPVLCKILSDPMPEVVVIAHFCESHEAARIFLFGSAYDLLIVDCDLQPGPGELLRGLHRIKPGGSTVTFAVASSGGEGVVGAYATGADFVWRRPLDAKRIGRSLRAACDLVLAGRRCRGTANFPVRIFLQSWTAVSGQGTDLSENGLAIVSPVPLARGYVLKLRFVLPQTTICFEAEGEVTRADSQGGASVRFARVDSDMQERLRDWLERASQQDPAGAGPSPPADRSCGSGKLRRD